jgi:hypothetical protein
MVRRKGNACCMCFVFAALITIIGIWISGSGRRSDIGTQSRPITILPAAQIHVFVGVLSRSTSHAARAAIRATWGAHPGLYRVVFFLAQASEADIRESVSEPRVVKLSSSGTSLLLTVCSGNP